MKFVYSILFCLLIGSTNAQSTLPNLGFETWTSSPENLSTPWATLNGLSTVFAPLTTTKTTDAHSGSFAAKLETKLYSGLLLSGLAATGNFSLSIIDPSSSLKTGKPFDGRPDSLAGWTKYTSVASDSAIVVLMLSKWNSVTNNRDTIGTAVYTLYNTTSNYARFSQAVDYVSVLTPDSIVIISTSSAGGGLDPAVGSVGSTLYIDDFQLIYNTSSLFDVEENYTYYQLENTLFFNQLLDGIVSIYSATGAYIRQLEVTAASSITLADLPPAVYFIRINNSTAIKAVVR